MRCPQRAIVGGPLALIVIAALVAIAPPAAAQLRILTPNPATPATFVGHGGYSADGLGQNGGGGALQADVPAGSTVVQAYLYGAYLPSSVPDPAGRSLDFDGTSVALATLANSGPFVFANARADVTALVAAKVGSGGGITNFTVGTDPADLDGVALVVVYANPARPLVTIALLDHGSSLAGDTVTFNFGAPLDPTTPGFHAIASVGSSFSSQSSGGHACGPAPQFSTIDVNDHRLTSCAGNYDDGETNNGALITVGGVGDSTDNPADPFSTTAGTDDELYSLVPFVHAGDTSLTVHTDNPPHDDNLFLVVVDVAAAATVTTEVCNNGADDDLDGLIDLNDPDCAGHVGLSDVHAWLGLRNSDDQGTQFDVLTEFFDNGNEVAFGFQRCVKGLTRNPARAQEVIVPWVLEPAAAPGPNDVLTIKVSVRIGTNSDFSKCAGPGGSHASAVGVRFYGDAAHSSRFGIRTGTGPTVDQFFTAPYADSGVARFAGGNAWSAIGTWTLH